MKFWGTTFDERERSSFTEFFSCLHKPYKQPLNKLTLKDNKISYCFMLFIFGGPCHLSSVLGTIFSSENRFFSQLWNSIIFLSYYYPINIVNIKILCLCAVSSPKLHTAPLSIDILNLHLFLQMVWLKTSLVNNPKDIIPTL